jgi:hypothetical protein
VTCFYTVNIAGARSKSSTETRGSWACWLGHTQTCGAGALLSLDNRSHSVPHGSHSVISRHGGATSEVVMSSVVWLGVSNEVEPVVAAAEVARA